MRETDVRPTINMAHRSPRTCGAITTLRPIAMNGAKRLKVAACCGRLIVVEREPCGGLGDGVDVSMRSMRKE
jgi:hypothetical protein